MSPVTFIQSGSLPSTQHVAAYTAEKSKTNIVHTIMSQNTNNYKILSTVYVFFLMALQLFGSTFLLLSLKLKLFLLLMES